MAILSAQTLDFISNSVEQTERLGVRLGELLTTGDLICLSGPLGTGKTSFTRGLGRGWGSAVRVTSPTFTLINQYPRARDGLVLYHVDCYRLAGTAEAADAADLESTGLFDLFDADGAMVIEWAERIEAFLPPERVWVALRHVDATRRGLRLEPQGGRPEMLLREFRQRAFGV